MAPALADEKLLSLPIDWDEIEQEATALLQRYLRIDTTNPPGGEEAGAQLLSDALRREGFEPQLYEAAEGRVSVSARRPGTNSAGTKPLVLLSHIDVVPAEHDHWSVDPFGGVLKDGVLWGRGALDMKGMGIMELLVLFLLKRHRVEHQRDILFLAVADEEEAGRYGMLWLADHHPELLRADVVINEGAFGFGELMGQHGQVFGIAASEKGPLWLRLTTQGRPGHGSLPHRENAALRLVQALARIGAMEPLIVLRPEVAAMLETLARVGMLPRELDFRDPQVLKGMVRANDLARALVTSTLSLTSVNAGGKHNVIPADASATLDCRLLPGDTSEAFLEELRDVIGDDGVEIEVIYRFDPLASEAPAELMAHVEAALRSESPGAVLMPTMCPAFTDSRIYRRYGVPAIGFVPVLLTTEELGTVHGHDERISTANLRLGTRVLLDTTRRVAGVP